MKCVTVRLTPGQDLKKEIERMAETKKINAGVLLSVVGSLKTATLRLAGSNAETQLIQTWNEAFEIIGGTGTISQFGCHVHIAVADGEGKVIGGHLKEGCMVQTTVEVVIGILKGVTYERIIDHTTGFKELEIF